MTSCAPMDPCTEKAWGVWGLDALPGARTLAGPARGSSPDGLCCRAHLRRGVTWGLSTRAFQPPAPSRCLSPPAHFCNLLPSSLRRHRAKEFAEICGLASFLLGFLVQICRRMVGGGGGMNARLPLQTSVSPRGSPGFPLHSTHFPMSLGIVCLLSFVSFLPSCIPFISVHPAGPEASHVSTVTLTAGIW